MIQHTIVKLSRISLKYYFHNKGAKEKKKNNNSSCVK